MALKVVRLVRLNSHRRNAEKVPEMPLLPVGKIKKKREALRKVKTLHLQLEALTHGGGRGRISTYSYVIVVLAFPNDGGGGGI